MTSPILSTLYRFSRPIRQWVHVNTLRPVAANLVIQEVHQHQIFPQEMMTTLTQRLYAGGLTLDQWQLANASLLKDAHLAEALFAVGGKANLSPQALARLRDTLRKEYTYLNQFAIDIKNGNVSEAQALARIKQYANAVQQSYWNEFQRDTPAGQMVAWVLHPAEHCSDCLDLAANSPYKPGECPTVPGAGATQCRGNCQCTLERR